MNPAGIKRFLQHYLYGLFAKCWNGSWSAVDAALGLAVGAVVTTAIDFPTLQGLAAIFITAWVRNAFTYFAKNPLPEKLETSNPFPKDIAS